MLFKKVIIAAISMLLTFSCGMKKEKEMTAEHFDSYLLVGTYTDTESKGVNLYKFNTETGTSTYISEAEVSNPSYLTLNKDGTIVYAVSEDKEGILTSFSFKKTLGALIKLSSDETGEGPCFVAIDSNDKYLATAQYSAGTVNFYSIDNEKALHLEKTYSFEDKNIDANRQTKSYLHNVVFSPDERFMFANDLGADKIYRFALKDKIWTYDKKNDIELKAGSGPRHTTFHPNGKFAYTITEISEDVIVFDYDAEKGLLSEKQSIKTDTLNAQGSADIHITPNGKFLYASNRLKNDGLAIFVINETTGELTKIGYQETDIHPRNFVITPNGKLLLVANRDSNNIQIFAIQEDGLLNNMNKDIELSKPVCLKFSMIE